MDNYWILGKSVEIKVSSKMAGYKMNLPFNAVLIWYNVDVYFWDNRDGIYEKL